MKEYILATFVLIQCPLMPVFCGLRYLPVFCGQSQVFAINYHLSQQVCFHMQERTRIFLKQANDNMKSSQLLGT